MGARLSARLGIARLTDTHEDALVARFAAMGTRIELHLFGVDGAVATDALEAARRAIEAVDDALTIHRPSPVTALNEALAAGAVATVRDPLLRDALAESAVLYRATTGLFDPAASPEGPGWPALGLDPECRSPPFVLSEVEAPVPSRTAFDYAQAERQGGDRGHDLTVRASRPVALDFGGFGKGFALDRAVAVLRDAGVTAAFLSAGESSIAVIGRHPLGDRWPVGVPHPHDPAAYLLECALEDAALSISATVGAGAQAPGRAASLHPATGAAMEEPRVAVAIAPSGAAAEALSTALLVADPPAGTALVAANPDRHFAFRLDRRMATPLFR